MSETCKVCDDVGVATFRLEDGSLGQRMCNEPGCKGAESVQEEAARMLALLSAIDDYRAIHLTRGANKVVVDRYRKRLFEESERYHSFLKKNQLSSPQTSTQPSA